MTKSDSPDGTGIDPELLRILACPRCKGKLLFVAALQSLDCLPCKLRYLVREGIPVLLIEEAQPI